VLIENLVLVSVETRRRHFCGDGNAHRVADSLPQRPRRAFHAGRIAEFRMAWCFGMQLPESFDFRHRQVVAAHVQPRVQEHAAVPARKNEDIAIDPTRFVWIVL
jgi:hypothetical protein